MSPIDLVQKVELLEKRVRELEDRAKEVESSWLIRFIIRIKKIFRKY